MASYIFPQCSSPCSPSSASSSSSPSDAFDLSLATLPDELLSMCYCSLNARDLVSLEQVSHRMRELVSADDVAWRECAKTSWGANHNFELMTMAAEIAGSWKQLYADKKLIEMKNSPWKVPSSHEIHAMLQLIKGPCTMRDLRDKNDPEAALSASPCSVIGEVRSPHNALGVVLLVDGSSSVTEDDFNAMKLFCIELINSLRKTHPESSVAILQFNQYPKVHAGLTRVDKPGLVNAVQTMSQMMGSTDIAAPIRRARQMLLEDGIAFAEAAIVILTDGQTHSDELREAEREARQAAMDSGARLFAMGVGRDVDEAGLRRVACGTSDFLATSPQCAMANGHYFPLRKMYR